MIKMMYSAAENPAAASASLPASPSPSPSPQSPHMDSFCLTYHRPLQLFPFSRRPASSISPSINFLKPSFSSSPKSPLLTLRTSSSSPPSKSPASSPPSFFRSASIAAAAAAAFFLFGLRKPALVSASLPPAAVAQVQPQDLPSTRDPETLSDPEQERVLEERLAAFPDDVHSLRSLMELKVKAGKIDEAIGIVDRMISVEPGDTDLHLLKAHLKSYSGDADTAKNGFEQLVEKDPFLVEAYHGLVMAASQSEDDEDLDNIVKRIENAMELCKQANKKEQLRDFRLLLAQIRVIEENYNDSLKIYEELVEEEPKDFRPYLCQGIVYTLLRKKDEAQKQFQKYRRLVPEGHPYAQYFEENMYAMEMFGQKEGNKAQPR